jgi:hypothetical protein
MRHAWPYLAIGAIAVAMFALALLPLLTRRRGRGRR